MTVALLVVALAALAVGVVVWRGRASRARPVPDAPTAPVARPALTPRNTGTWHPRRDRGAEPPVAPPPSVRHERVQALLARAVADLRGVRGCLSLTCIGAVRGEVLASTSLAPEDGVDERDLGVAAAGWLEASATRLMAARAIEGPASAGLQAIVTAEDLHLIVTRTAPDLLLVVALRPGGSLGLVLTRSQAIAGAV